MTRKYKPEKVEVYVEGVPLKGVEDVVLESTGGRNHVYVNISIRRLHNSPEDLPFQQLRKRLKDRSMIHFVVNGKQIKKKAKFRGKVVSMDFKKLDIGIDKNVVICGVVTLFDDFDFGSLGGDQFAPIAHLMGG